MSQEITRASYWLPEWHQAAAIWLRWPFRSDIFAFQARAAQADLKALIAQLNQTDLRIELMVPNAELARAQQFLQPVLSEKLRFHTLSYGDVWLRDCAPFICHDGKHQHFLFDSWGGIDDQWPLDIMARDWLSRWFRVPSYKNNLLLEGGALYTDGEGTALASAGSLLRRPTTQRIKQQTSAAHYEAVLKTQLGIEKVIWIEGCLQADETGGHIDNMACFIAPGEVAVSMPSCSNHPDYQTCLTMVELLQQETDAQGRPFKVHPLPLPSISRLTQEEADSLVIKAGVLERPARMPLMTSYINFIRAGDWVIFPEFGLPEDAQALQKIKTYLPDCQVLTAPTRALVVGGGGWHCASWVEPVLLS